MQNHVMSRRTNVLGVGLLMAALAVVISGNPFDLVASATSVHQGSGEMNHSAPAVLEHDEHMHRSETDGRDGEEVHGPRHVQMIAQEGQPSR